MSLTVTGGLSRVTSEEEGKRSLDEHGHCVIDDALEPEHLATIQRTLLAKAEDDRRTGVHPADVRTVQKVGLILNLDPVYAYLAEHPKVFGLLHHLLGDDFLLSNMNASIAMPEPDRVSTDPGRNLHHDQGYVTYPPPPYAVAAVAMWMVDDFTVENGATGIVPGSHKENRWPSQDEQGLAVPITGRAGSVAVWDGRLFHQVRQNHTERPRTGIVAYYCRPWIRTQMNHFASSLHPSVVENATDRLKVLLGYKTFLTLGIIHDGNGPANFTGAA